MLLEAWKVLKLAARLKPRAQRPHSLFPTIDMKARTIPSLFYSTILLGCFGPRSSAQMKSLEKQVVPLDQGWEFRQRGAPPGASAAEWLPAQVPGDVHLDLLRHRLIPDPFYRDNEAKLQWISPSTFGSKLRRVWTTSGRISRRDRSRRRSNRIRRTTRTHRVTTPDQDLLRNPGDAARRRGAPAISTPRRCWRRASDHRFLKP
jgi:hypothetical protein